MQNGRTSNELLTLLGIFYSERRRKIKCSTIVVDLPSAVNEIRVFIRLRNN